MIYELFSRRKSRQALSGIADVYQYATVPDRLRVQVHQILLEAIGPQYTPSPYAIGHTAPHNPDAWELIEKTLCREMGLHKVAHGETEAAQVLAYLSSTDVDGFLDVVELCSRYIDRVLGPMEAYRRDYLGIKQNPEAAIEEINFRFRESAFGFQYEQGQMMRVDAEYTHQELVKPALVLLSQPEYEGPQAEFLQAHRYYRAGEYAQSITEAAKAFESTLKVVCNQRGWAYQKGSRASDLLRRVRQEGLWPEYLDSSFDQLLGTLNSGLPKVRNEEGAHGQGATVRVVPDYVAAYALHLAGCKIRLVAEAAKAT